MRRMYGLSVICCLGFACLVVQQSRRRTVLEDSCDVSACVAAQCWKILDPSREVCDVSKVTRLLQEFASGGQKPLDYEAACAKLAEYEVQFEEKKLEQAWSQVGAFLRKVASWTLELISGRLYYTVLQEGGGPLATAEDCVCLHLREESALTGEVGQDTYTKHPVWLRIPDLVPALRRALVGMQVGERRRVYAHPDLVADWSYIWGLPAAIIYEIEMISIGK